MNSTPTSLDSGAYAPRARLIWPERRLILLLMANCYLAHFNRVSMAVAADARIMDQYGISPTEMGWVYSAFLLAYTAMMIPGGWLIDRRGPHHALALMCLGSALFVIVTGTVGLTIATGALAFGALLIVRSLMGAVSAPLHPASARAVSLEIPAQRRSAANGLITGAALLGVASQYAVFGRMIDLWGWPTAFIVAGLVTTLCGALWVKFGYVSPEARSRAETAHFETVQPELATLPAAEVSSPSRSVATFARPNFSLLVLTLSYAAAGYFQYLFFYWVHYYFERVLQLGSDESRIYSTLPPLAMAVGMPLGGWLSDRLLEPFGWRVARAGLAMFSMAASGGLLLCAIAAREPAWIALWMSLSMGVMGMAEGPFWVTAVEVGGRRGGMSAAIFNTGGNIGGALAPVVTPWISDSLDLGWQAGLTLGSGAALLGAVLWWWIDPGKSTATAPSAN